MATLQGLIDQAYFQYLRGVDAAVAPNKDDATGIMEALLPTVFQDVAMRYAANPDKRSLLRRTHTIAMTNGVGTLPDEVLSAGKAGATISDPDDVTVAQSAAMVWYWNDFVAPRSGLLLQIPQWIIKGDDVLVYLEADEEYDSASGFTGDLDLTIASVPEIPATAATTLDVPNEVLSDLVAALADALRIQTRAAA